MNGLTKQELYDILKNHHEVEFQFNGETFVIQPETEGGLSFLTLWRIDDDPACISKTQLSSKDTISDNEINSFLGEICLDGKSFLDIAEQVTVTIVY